MFRPKDWKWRPNEDAGLAALVDSAKEIEAEKL
jgi:hypothetical protein